MSNLLYVKTRALLITTVLSLCLEKFLVGLLGMNVIRSLNVVDIFLFLGTDAEFFVTPGSTKGSIF